MTKDPAAIDDFDEILEAADRLLEATGAFEAAVLSYGGAIKLGRELAHASNNVLPLQHEIEELRQAVKIVRSGAPIARRDDRGAIWKHPLTPRGISLHAALARADDAAYLPQLEQVLKVERDRSEAIAADLAVKCGRKNGCENPKVYWPGRGHAGAPACWVHVTAEERSSLEALYDQARAEFPCPGCDAEPGRACSDDSARLQLIDGRWPKMKSFSKRRLHTERLDLTFGGSV